MLLQVQPVHVFVSAVIVRVHELVRQHVLHVRSARDVVVADHDARVRAELAAEEEARRLAAAMADIAGPENTFRAPPPAAVYPASVSVSGCGLHSLSLPPPLLATCLSLDASRNALTEVGVRDLTSAALAPGCVSWLRELVLSRNNIDTFPALHGCRALMMLDLSICLKS